MKQRYGESISKNSPTSVINLSEYHLSDNEKFVLEHGLNYCMQPKHFDNAQIKAEFEILFRHLHPQHTAISEDSFNSLQAKLASTAHEYCDLKPVWSSSPFNTEHLKCIKALKMNKDIVIIRADKGGACVVLDKKDYVSKMENILMDESKFKILGPVESHDETARTEKDFREYLASLKSKNLLSDAIIERIRPVGSQRARMYGLPKVHKSDVPLRPILSTINTSARPVAEYLKEILQPIHDKYSNYCAQDSFSFAAEIKSMQTQSSTFMCSYDIKSLFTNIPLGEVIDICANALYSDENVTPPPFSKSIFTALLEFATCGVEFSFNNIMYKQLEGCGMGNVLSSLLSNIYVGYLEHQMFNAPKCHHPLFYKRYVDDTFALFTCKEDSILFFDELNSLSSLEFTMEEESKNQLPFLDVLIERQLEGFTTSVYRKPTFAGTYQKWNSFSPQSRKISLLEMIVHRALNDSLTVYSLLSIFAH